MTVICRCGIERSLDYLEAAGNAAIRVGADN